MNKSRDLRGWCDRLEELTTPQVQMRSMQERVLSDYQRQIVEVLIHVNKLVGEIEVLVEEHLEEKPGEYFDILIELASVNDEEVQQQLDYLRTVRDALGLMLGEASKPLRNLIIELAAARSALTHWKKVLDSSKVSAINSARQVMERKTTLQG